MFSWLSCQPAMSRISFKKWYPYIVRKRDMWKHCDYENTDVLNMCHFLIGA